MKRLSLFTVLLALLVLLAAVAPVEGTCVRLLPSTYTKSNTVLISGWDWMRPAAGTPTVVWKINVAPATLAGAKIESFYVLVEALVTNTTSGGAGYERPLVLWVTNAAGTTPVQVELHNPFRPVDPVNSAGLGYITYGYAQINDQRVINNFKSTGKLEVMFMWQGGYHVAVKADSAKIAFQK